MSTELISFKEPRALAGLAAKPPAVWFASSQGGLHEAEK